MDKQHFTFTQCNDELKIAGLYDMEETIGKGHFAVVKLARHVFTGEKVAVKVINKDKLDSVSREHLFQEVMCMKLVQHPNVVRLYEVIDTMHKLYLILELGDGGDLYDYIMKHDRGISEASARNIFSQIVHAIAYCHKLHVVHRDLKPENVVYFEKLGIVKLTDFGFSNRFIPGEFLETSCGSLAYSAPEILLGDAYDAPKVDIWSLGVILYMMVCGSQPFEAATDSEMLTNIMDCKFSLPATVSVECQELISQMLIRDPDKRLSLDQIMSNNWLTMHFDGSRMNIFSVPLISKELITDEHHNEIVTKMADGNLATTDSIQSAIQQNEYSYITATYYLLAERKLKRQYMEHFRRKKSQESEEPAHEPSHSPTGLVHRSSVRVLDQPALTTPEETLRRFSMILENEEEDEEDDALASLASVRLELETGLGLLGFSTDNSDSCESDTSNSSGIHKTPNKNKRRRHNLVSVKSSPQLLNNITEEEGNSSGWDPYLTATGSSVFESVDISTMSTQRKPSTVKVRPRTTHFGASPTFLHRFGRNSDGLRSTSRSSSENSDTESEIPKISNPITKTIGKDSSTLVTPCNTVTPTNNSAVPRCAPIREEEELPSSSSLPSSSHRTEIESRNRSESMEGVAGARLTAHPNRVNSNFSLTGSLTQSNFSLSSLASSLCGSKVMIDVIRGTFDQHVSKKVPLGQGELSSLRSLPEPNSFPSGDRSRISNTPPRCSNNNSVPVLTSNETSLKPRLKIPCCVVS